MRLRNEHIQMSPANRKLWLLYFSSIPKVPKYFLAWEIPSNDRSLPIFWVNASPLPIADWPISIWEGATWSCSLTSP